MLRLCIVGFGRWGRIYYRAIEQLPYCVVDSIVITKPRIETFSVPTYYRIEDVILNRRIDAFIIATPPSTHHELTSICILNNYPVLVEKPFTTSHKQALQLQELSISRGVLCVVGYQHLFSDNYKKLKEKIVLNTGRIDVHSEAISLGPVRKDVSVFRDWGSHEIAMALDLFKEHPLALKIKRIAGEYNDVYNAVYLMNMEFSLGHKYNAIFGNLSEVKRKSLLINYTTGWAYLDLLNQNGFTMMKNAELVEPQNILRKNDPPLTSILEYFLHKVEQKRIHSSTLELGVKTAKVLDTYELD